MSVTAAVSSAAPATSMRAPERRAAGGIVRSTTRSASAPSGRLIRKIQRHDAASVSVPPTSGPAIAAVAHTAPM
jgi:hypothetical protein